MQTTIIVAALLLGIGEPDMVHASDVARAPQEFQAAVPRPYAPSITVFYPSPTYDCYSRDPHRLDCYPTFRQRHYRRPYNYRVKFDYPWHEDVYRNWPDACLYDDGAPQWTSGTHAMYSGPRRGAPLEQRDLPSGVSSNATTNRAAPLVQPRTLR